MNTRAKTVKMIRGSRGGTVQPGDLGKITYELSEGYVSVFWPTRFVTTVEHLGKDVTEVAA
jgi:hypothetical protein